MGMDRILWRLAMASILLAIGSFAWTASATRPHPVYAVGDSVRDLGEIRFDLSAQSIVVWVNTRCEACAQSLPFYRRIADAARSSRLIVVGPEPEAVLREFMEAAGVRPNQVVSTGSRDIRLWFTPTLLLVDRSGMVRYVYVGLMKPVEEDRILLALE